MSIIFMLLLGCADTTKVEEKLSAIETKLSNLETKLAEKPKERVIVDYKVVCTKSIHRDRTDAERLAKQVKELIKDGWTPISGSVWHAQTFCGFSQTMVKYE